MIVRRDFHLDGDRLGKFLRLAGQDNDGEALNALRKAQKLLSDSGLSWDWLIERANIEERAQPDDLPF